MKKWEDELLDNAMEKHDLKFSSLDVIIEK